MSWDEINQTLDAQQKASGFYQMVEGNNRMRLLEIPKQIGSHYVQASKKSYTCVGTGCGFCARGEKNRVQFMAHAIIRGAERAQDQVMIVKLGSTIMDALRALRADAEWTFETVPSYDITVVKKKTGSEAKDVEYTLVASPTRSELTANEKEMVEKMKPITEIVQKMIDKARGELNDNMPLAPAPTDEINVADIPF